MHVHMWKARMAGQRNVMTIGSDEARGTECHRFMDEGVKGTKLRCRMICMALSVIGVLQFRMTMTGPQ
jgi:hypothetical protein